MVVDGGTAPPDERTLRVAAVQVDYDPRLYTSQQRLWVPSEPFLDVDAILSDRPGSPRSLESPDLPEAVREVNAEVMDRAEAEYESAFNLRLGQVLSYLVENDVDIAVFPESCVPPS